jgi:GDPmannose 4,6-dehydratase
MFGTGLAGTALVTGITGQDGWYLSELLLDRGFSVHGLLSPSGRQNGLRPEVTPHVVDLTSTEAVVAVVGTVQPDLVFHLAGISSVATSWQQPVLTTRVNVLSIAAVLDACLRAQRRTGKKIVVVNASSSEIFAGADDSPQTEATRLRPISPYGASKATGHMMCQVYRAEGLEASNAILYNHESPRRSDTFVTRKITKAAAAIATGQQDRLSLGDLSIERDWGWAPDYVDAMYRMAVHGRGDDFIVATGESHSVADFVAAAFTAAGIADWQLAVDTDASLLRPADRPATVGDASKARAILGWQPTISFEHIVNAMVYSDLRQEQHT